MASYVVDVQQLEAGARRVHDPVDTFMLFGDVTDKTLDLLAVGDVCMEHGIIAEAGLEAVA